eukprot:2793215-Alexandrium_andersonii.AAC.1
MASFGATCDTLHIAWPSRPGAGHRPGARGARCSPRITSGTRGRRGRAQRSASSLRGKRTGTGLRGVARRGRGHEDPPQEVWAARAEHHGKRRG